MKNKRNPRLENAIKKALSYLQKHECCWWISTSADYLGKLIYYFGYKADKYDVLNENSDLCSNNVITFARGDIRHHNKLPYLSDCLFIFFVLMLAVIIINLLCVLY